MCESGIRVSVIPIYPNIPTYSDVSRYMPIYQEGGVAFVSITTDPPASYYFCVLPLELNLTPHREDGTS